MFSHGFFDNANQAYRYVKEYPGVFYGKTENDCFIVDGKLKTFDYPDVLCRLGFLGKIPKIYLTSLGQDNEIEALKKAYDQIDDDEIVLVGVSRGASVIASFLGKHKPKNIKAAVLISPFDNAVAIFKYHWFAGVLAKLPYVTQAVVYNAFKKISSYDEKKKNPVDWVSEIAKEIPVAFICTKTDATVPYWSTINLYNKLVESGHKKGHLLCLESGRHAKMMQADQGDVIQNFVHAFYKVNGLSYNKEFAKKGYELLKKDKNE